MTYSQEEYDIAVTGAYQKGKWLNASFFDVRQEEFYKQEEANMALKLLDIEMISKLTKERDELKEKYLKVLEHLSNFTTLTTDKFK